MKILVTGGAGYLGTVLVPKLLARGHCVRVLDVGYFGVGHLRSFRTPVELIREDIRRVLVDEPFCESLVDGCDCIIHLAAISNDPSAELNPSLTHEVNYDTTVKLAETAKKKNCRFIFSSSCSIYGEANGEIDEQGAVNPLTVYAESKVRAEQALAALANDIWHPISLRNGTLFGYSPRMRFDLVINIFSLYSTLHNTIKIFGDGLQWRPYLHVDDCARAFVHFAEIPDYEFLCYNIAHQNLRVVDVGTIFQCINPNLKISHVELLDIDRRDYSVSTRRVQKAGFKTRVDIDMGAQALVEAIMSGVIADPESIYYRNAKWLKELTQIGAKDHREILGLMETLSMLHPTAKFQM